MGQAVAGAASDAIPVRAFDASAGRGDTEQAPGPGRGAKVPDAAARRGPGRGPDPFPNQPVITVETGDFDPVIGRSYREISVISRNEHRSQGQGAPLSTARAENLLALVAGEMPAKASSMGSIPPGPRIPAPSRAGELLAKAQREFDDLHPEKTVAALLEARPVIAGLARDGQTWAQWKLDEIDEAIALCAGLRTEVQADAPAFVPGGTAKVR